MLTTTDDRFPSDAFPSDPRADPRADPWSDWKPDWKKNGARTPHDLQERHSRTVPAPETRRRITDARTWDAMTPQQQDAACEIAAVFEGLTRGLGFASADLTRLPGSRTGGNPADIQARLMAGYTDWTTRCHRAGVSHSMVIDVLVFGHSCHALDHDRRVAAGWSKRNLLSALSLYCAVRGWPS